MNWKNMMLAGILLFSVSCGSGGSPPIDNGFFATLTGVVTIDGALLADLGDPQLIDDQDVEKWTVRLIDPTESVDSIELPHSDTAIVPVDIVPYEGALLEIELLPAVDLSGGTASVTPVTLALAVPLTDDLTTVVNASVTVLPATGVSSVRSASQLGGGAIRLAYNLHQGLDVMSELIEIDWNGMRLRRDTNGNGRVDDEVYFTDSDRNGISDIRQQGLQEGQGSGAALQLAGSIAALDIYSGVLTLDGQACFVDEQTVITGIDKSIITLQELQTGWEVEASVRRGRFGGYYLQKIEVVTQ